MRLPDHFKAFIFRFLVSCHEPERSILVPHLQVSKYYESECRITRISTTIDFCADVNASENLGASHHNKPLIFTAFFDFWKLECEIHLKKLLIILEPRLDAYRYPACYNMKHILVLDLAYAMTKTCPKTWHDMRPKYSFCLDLRISYWVRSNSQQTFPYQSVNRMRDVTSFLLRDAERMSWWCEFTYLKITSP